MLLKQYLRESCYHLKSFKKETPSQWFHYHFKKLEENETKSIRRYRDQREKSLKTKPVSKNLWNHSDF